MKTQHVLSATEADLVPELRKMKIKELERHAQKILSQLGEKDFDGVMKNMIQLMQSLEEEGGDRFEKVQQTLRDLLNLDKDASLPSDVIQRLAVVVVVLITKKFQKVRKEL